MQKRNEKANIHPATANLIRQGRAYADEAVANRNFLIKTAEWSRLKQKELALMGS